MRTGRPAVQITLTRQEHAELSRRRAQRKGPADLKLRAEISFLALAVNPAHRLPGAWVLLLRPYRGGVFASHNGDLRGLRMSLDLGDPAVSVTRRFRRLLIGSGKPSLRMPATGVRAA
ncbi:hypothetical protein IQ22_03601 [Pseudomonas duriflava]|uniref:Uncharacterized protein n=1 Tax=Pseudomonas duriflava TaxID=459528 RepID=A0A562Q2N2_9PSED|nr:hypothetical protein IQ22_03601 [Pseudomonas duriflava]